MEVFMSNSDWFTCLILLIVSVLGILSIDSGGLCDVCKRRKDRL